MADGWDLYAVVRSCTTATATTPSVDSINMMSTNNNHMAEMEDPFPNNLSSADLTFQNADTITTPFSSYPGQNTTTNYPHLQGLEEIYNQLYVQPQLFSTPQINSTTTFSITHFEGFENQQEIHQPQQQQQQPQLNNFLAPPASNFLTLPITNSQTVRSRRRKNQQMKMVRQMTQEELSGDSWAWRKYGQKPIKGSPYPRNYYKCSTSKGCAARKQVERSPMDSTIFIVSYTGEHTHPRPTHRSSLAGSTRNKFSAVVNNKSTSGDMTNSSAPNFAVSKPSCSSSSPASASSFSPTMEGESAPHHDNIQVDDVEMIGVDDDDQDILIPNTVMTEDIFKGFQELNGGRGFFD